jgi:hypothetical protein
MFVRRGFGIVGILVALAVAALVGVLAYQAGLAVNLSHAPAGAYVGPWAWGWGIGFGAFHLIGLLLFVLLLVALFRFAFRPRGFWGGYGPGPWQGGPPPFVQERFDEMHRRAHGAAPAAPEGEGPAPPTISR